MVPLGGVGVKLTGRLPLPDEGRLAVAAPFQVLAEVSRCDSLHEPPESIGFSLGVLIAGVASATRERLPVMSADSRWPGKEENATTSGADPGSFGIRATVGRASGVPAN
jgi:hypothetical protein